MHITVAMLVAVMLLTAFGDNMTRTAFAGGDAALLGCDEPEPAALNPASWPDDALTLANLGHSTLLMNFMGVRVLSDPALFDRVGLTLGPAITIGPHRMTAAPLSPSQLGRLDVILITHAHMDHLDINSLKALPRSVVVIACVGCGNLIRPLGYDDVRELRWGDRTEVDGLRITAMGASHWGRRWPWGRDYGFNSYVLEKVAGTGVSSAMNAGETPAPLTRMLLACDSAFTDIFAAAHQRPPDIAAFSIGAYDPWIWNHADPEQVWNMFRQTGARYLVPLHWGTFRLSKEPMDEPLRRLIAAAGAQSDRIVLRQIGVAWTLPQVSSECRFGITARSR